MAEILPFPPFSLFSVFKYCWVHFILTQLTKIIQKLELQCFLFQSNNDSRDHSNIDDDSLDQSGLSEENSMIIDIDGKTAYFISLEEVIGFGKSLYTWTYAAL